MAEHTLEDVLELFPKVTNAQQQIQSEFQTFNGAVDTAFGMSMIDIFTDEERAKAVLGEKWEEFHNKYATMASSNNVNPFLLAQDAAKVGYAADKKAIENFHGWIRETRLQQGDLPEGLVNLYRQTSEAAANGDKKAQQTLNELNNSDIITGYNIKQAIDQDVGRGGFDKDFAQQVISQSIGDRQRRLTDSLYQEIGSDDAKMEKLYGIVKSKVGEHVDVDLMKRAANGDKVREARNIYQLAQTVAKTPGVAGVKQYLLNNRQDPMLATAYKQAA